MIDRIKAPKISLPSSVELLKVETITLGNGLTVHVLGGCPEPVLNLSIFLNAGKYYQSKEFASGFTSSLLKKGTKNFSANEIAEKLDFLGSSLNIQSGMFKMTVSLSCLKSKLNEILPIVKDILTESIFPEEEIDLEKKRRIQSLKINQGKTNYIAAVKFNESIFGSNHSCGYEPTEKSLNAISRKDILEHFDQFTKLNDKSYMIVSGDIDEKVIDSINENFGKILMQESTKNIENPFKRYSEKEVYIAKKNSVQSSIRIGMSLIDVKHEDYLDLEILNRILGGYFGSRLMKNIREDKGYTYGIYSYLSPFENGSYFCIATDVGIEYKEATINEISKEINRLKTELVSDEELQMVKNYHKGRIIKSVDGSMRYANVLGNILSLGLEENRVNLQLEVVENITSERIKELANKYLNFEDMYKIVVG